MTEALSNNIIRMRFRAFGSRELFGAISGGPKSREKVAVYVPMRLRQDNRN